MCGRGVRPEGPQLVEGLTAELVDDEVRTLPARYNLAPTEPVGILWRDGSSRRLSVARWGVPRPGTGAGSGSRGGIAINARDDRLRSGMWRPLLSRGRAVIPLRGFFEWEGPHRQPWYFQRSDGALLLLAGLVQEERDARHATIITTTPSPDIGGVHDRMPAILEPDMVEPWLCESTPDALAAMIGPADEGTLQRHTVSAKVNSVRNDGPELLQPAAPAAVQTQLF